MKTLNRIVVVSVLSAVVLATGVLSTGVANAKLDLTSEGVRVAASKFRSSVTTTSSSQSMTCATGAKCVLGDIGPGGGQVFMSQMGLVFSLQSARFAIRNANILRRHQFHGVLVLKNPSKQIA